MPKARIGLGSQIVKAMVFETRAIAIPGVSPPLLDVDTRWIRELIRDGEFDGYITARTFEELVQVAGQEPDSVELAGLRVATWLRQYHIQVASSITSKSQLPQSGEIGDYMSMILQLNLDIFITKTIEMFETFLLTHHELRAEFKTFILTPRMFGKLKRAQHMNSRPKSGWGYQFRLIESPDELELLHQFETEILPQDTALTASKLYEWWQTYQAGVKALFLNSRLMGVLSLWPLSNSMVQQIKQQVAIGKFTEYQLDVLPYQEGQTCRYWYIGGFYLHESLRGQGLSESLARKFLLRSLTYWLAGGKNCYRPALEQGIELLAMPVNPFAQSILLKYGFRAEPGASQEGFPLYAKTIRSISDLSF